MTSTATIIAAHKALGATPGQSVVTRAEEVMGRLARPGNLGEILGWTGEESLASAAVRVVRERDVARRERDEAYRQRDEAQTRLGEWASLRSQINDARAILGAAAGDLLSDAVERAACAVQHEANAMDIIGRALGRKVVGGADVAAIHASEEIERLRERVADLEAAEAEPPQVFRPPISVTVRHACDHPFAEVVIGAIQDPAFLALPMGARLGLVVCDD
jgi:hypothetical protein